MKKRNRTIELPFINEIQDYSNEEEKEFANEMGILDDLNIANILDGEELEEYIKKHS